MPRKKRNPNSAVFADSGAAATGRSRTRKVITRAFSETGDAYRDGRIWFNRISQARTERYMRKNGERDWRRYYEWYEGEQWNDRGAEGGNLATDNARPTATVNKTGSLVNSIIPFLINGEIRFLLKPQRPADDVAAQLQQTLLNYEWREQKMTRQVRTAIRDMVIIGHGILKTGYALEVDEAVDVEKLGNINYADYVRKNNSWIERVNPLNFLFDTHGRDRSLHTARWCAEVFYVPYADVIANKEYDEETLAMIWSGNHTPTTQAAFETFPAPSNTRGTSVGPLAALPEDTCVVILEIWDKKFEQRMLYADGVPRPLLVQEKPYDYLDNFWPYTMGAYIDCPNKPYPIGLPRWIEDQQLQLNRNRTAQFNHVRSYQRKFIISPEMDQKEVEKWERGGDGTGVQGPPDGIKPIADAPMSQDFQIVEVAITRDMEEATGADSLVQGRALPSRTTAGEVSARTRITGLKLDSLVSNTEEFVTDTAVQVLHHVKAHKTVEDAIEIAGAQGQFWEEGQTPEDIKADTDVEVEYFAAPKTDPTLEQNQKIRVFQIAVQALPFMAEQGQEVIDMPNLIGWVLDSFGEKDIGRFFRPALAPRPPLKEGESAGAGRGMPPALAGQFAPAQIGETPGVENPGEGASIEDLMQQLRGGIQ